MKSQTRLSTIAVFDTKFSRSFHNRDDWPLLFNADFSGKPALQGFYDALIKQ